MKLAAIDIGTNSTRLLITDYRHNKFFPLERKMEITRLGKDLDKDKVILENSAQKTLEALSGYWHLVRNYNVKKYRAVGTSAVREASNSDWFVSYVYERLGIEVDVISGPEEAKLSFYGAVRDIGLNRSGHKVESDVKILVMDIGGGSSEFILGDCDYNLELIKSVDLGCVSLSERFIGSGTPDMGSMGRMRRRVANKLEDTVEKIKQYKPVFVIGVGGTITTLAAVDLKLETYNSERIHGYILNLERVEDICKDLCGLNLEERRKVVGLDPKRADIIVGGTVIVVEVLKMLNIKEILVSERDILDGIIYTLVDF